MLKSTAYKFQIVSDGVYEQALNLYLKDEINDNIIKLQEFFDNPKNHNVSFEVFFTDGSYKCFIGFVIEPLDRSSQQQNLVSLLNSVKVETDLQTACELIAKVFKTTVILKDPDFKEVGFDVFWGSRGHTIVQKNEFYYDFDQLVQDYPQFNGQYNDRHIMMEQAWNKNEKKGIKYRYWLAAQISKECGLVDEGLYTHHLYPKA